ncbi:MULTISPECIES: GNAT family N-acetyltransferase [unclassified Mesorhizobium]|uniref:GNAT family N-acetyltransferase n=1 Tax=unclassified Mesorhizobium TaxID=325217 RepID=UPI001CCCC5AE|nr:MULTISPECIES: GNAT family N-acetyltransferase [unclassified Mesorhizobium]MBZ9743408.1 GNAT family N-acetyltransferase [Mesorhizobium sp. CO1-1-4]MBZ9805423.1 GNAT family N-acetyltransferase [Mesorhizobium sp. ES1-6]
MTNIQFRKAVAADLPAIVAMLADDPLGAGREDASLPLAQGYVDAFAAIDADPNQLLAVAVDGGAVIGTLQITFLAGLSRKGAWRGQIEAVRVADGRRSDGIGRKMVEWAIGQCKARGCGLVQLTTDKGRADAHRFYEGLGFTASHIGYKKSLQTRTPAAAGV